MEQESGFPGGFCDCSDASADLLCVTLSPPASCFHDKEIEDTCVLLSSAYLSVFCAAVWAAAPGVVAVLAIALLSFLHKESFL